MVKKKVKISIIIPSWNTKRLLRQCLKSLISNIHSEGIPRSGQYQISNCEVIVVDNGSTDGSVEMLCSLGHSELVSESKNKKILKSIQDDNKNLTLILNKTNLGYGAANNQALRQAQGEYVLLLNSDTIVKNNAPEKMAEFLASYPKVGVVGCKLLNPDGSPQPSAGRFPNLWVAAIMLFVEHWLGGHLVRTSYNRIREVDWVMGAALMFKREVVDKAGPMDEGIFMYMDEVEWCYRIKKAGYKVMFYPGAKIVHLGGGSSKTGRKDPILNIYRGLLYFYKKHYPSWQLPILRMMLKLKAGGALFIGYLTNNSYLKETHAQALKIV